MIQGALARAQAWIGEREGRAYQMKRGSGVGGKRGSSWLGGIGGAVVIGVGIQASGCGGEPRPPPPPPTAKPPVPDARALACKDARDLLAKLDGVRKEGRLALALDQAEEANRKCPSPEAQMAMDELRAELWLDERARDAYRACRDDGCKAEGRAAESTLALLGSDSSAKKIPGVKEMRAADALYSRGLDEREPGDHAKAGATFLESYIVW